MSFSNTAENQVLHYVFAGSAVLWAGASSLYIALHNADPGETGTSATNETAYGGYTRAVLTRASDFTISGNQVSNANLEQFPQCTSGTDTLTWASIVTEAGSSGIIIARAQLSTSIPVSTGIQPQFAASALTFTLD